MHKLAHKAKSESVPGQFVVTRERGEVISAVEGLQLSAEMRLGLNTLAAEHLPPDQRRAAIKALAVGTKRS